MQALCESVAACFRISFTQVRVHVWTDDLETRGSHLPVCRHQCRDQNELGAGPVQGESSVRLNPSSLGKTSSLAQPRGHRHILHLHLHFKLARLGHGKMENHSFLHYKTTGGPSKKLLNFLFWLFNNTQKQRHFAANDHLSSIQQLYDHFVARYLFSFSRVSLPSRPGELTRSRILTGQV